MAGVRHFRELECWELARELKLKLYELINRPIVHQDLKFCDQLREAARSAPRNIAEGFGRRTHAEFARFLDVARGSLAECENHLQDALDLKYLSNTEHEDLVVLIKRTGGAVARLQRYLRGDQ
jgi:four helix bundle protein